MLVDVVVVVLLVVYAVSGFRKGLLVGALSLVGFGGGALLGAQAARPLSDRVDGVAATTLVALAAVVVPALVGQVLAVAIGSRLRDRVRSRDLRRLDSLGGALLGVAGVLLVVWVLAVPLASSPFPAVAAQVRQSRVVAGVDRVVPDPVRTLYSSLRGALDRSGVPSVFGDLGRTPATDVAPPDAALATAPEVARVQGSVVKVVGSAPSCDRGLEGSGFVYAPDHVMTNAHVVAGTDRVEVHAPGQGTLAARVVAYDPERDVAVLDVPGLAAAPLAFATGTAAPGTDALVLGYPQDGPFDVRAARVAGELRATGRDIYDDATVARRIYSVRALVRSGNSGGPLLDARGAVLGVVFATALDVPDTGFALTAGEVAPVADRARAATAAVGTGACTSG